MVQDAAPSSDAPPLEIAFEHDGKGIADAPAPVPMRAAAPDWFRRMPARFADDVRQAADVTRLTVRACPPFAEAMSAGYAILWPSTITLRVTGRAPDGSFRVLFEPAEPQFIMAHPPRQAPDMPGSELPMLKLLSPWVIRTPPGTSCLILPMLNRLDRPYIPFAAVVETDRFAAALHFPFIFVPPSAGHAQIECGEPFVQVVPFRRERWKAACRNADPADLAGTRALLDSGPEGVYARHFRVHQRFE